MRNKSMKKFMGGLLALAMALTMGIGAAPKAMAAGPTGGTLAAPAQAYFSKTLNVPAGVANPVSGSFSFAWAKNDLDGSTAAEDVAAMPELPAVTLDPLAGTGAVQTELKNTENAAIGKAYSVSSPNIVAGVTFPQPGIYSYTLKEIQSGYTGILPASDSITYSAAEYRVQVQVALDTASSNTYVENIIVDQTAGDSGTQGGGKVPLDPDSTTPQKNKFLFVNGYKQTGGGSTPSGKKGVLELSKKVTNAPADGVPSGVATSFVFDMTLGKAPSEVGTPTYHYEVFDNAGTSKGAGTIDFTADTATATKPITLSNGDYAIFIDLPVGTVYDVKENGGSVIGNYNTSYSVSDAAGTAASVTGMAVSPQTIEATGAHSAACTNRYFSTTTPTGILLNNLPFVLLIVAAVGAAAVFLVAKRRRAN